MTTADCKHAVKSLAEMLRDDENVNPVFASNVCAFSGYEKAHQEAIDKALESEDDSE